MARLTEYTNEQVAHALALLEHYQGNAKKAAHELGIPRTTLRQWAGRAKSSNAMPKQIQPDMELAAKFERVAGKALDHAETEEVLSKAGLKDLLVAADIATRSSRLLKGQSTSNNLSLKIELVAGGSLMELAARTMNSTETAHLPILEGQAVEVQDKQQP